MDPEKLLDLQVQMRRNQEDLTDYLRDMESWEKEIKVKEEQLVSKQTRRFPKDLPPVRNSLTKKALKKKPGKKKIEKETVESGSTKRIRGYDYRSWDKFDVDKACEDVDKDDRQNSSSSEYETDEEAEEERKRQLANSLKDEGNQYFKTEQYDMAVECYSRGLEVDSNNVQLLLNRAMAFLKQEKFGAAEQDCTKAMLVGAKDAKAWFRRGCARESLKRYNEALCDFEEVLKIDSRNKAALNKVESIRNMLNPPPPSNIIKAVYIPPEKRSKKPLRHVVIEEVGIEDENNYHRLAKTDQSSDFDRFLSRSENTDNNISVLPKSNSIIEVVDETKAAEETRCDLNNTVDCDLNASKSEDAEEMPKYSAKESVVHEKSNEERNKLKTSSDHNPQTVANDGHLEGKSEGVPEKPQNACQFQAHWKMLKRTSFEFFLYFKQIDPKDYRSLFTLAFDDELLTKILFCLKEFYDRENIDVFAVLDNLTRVKRFSTIIMFLSPQSKQVLRDLFAKIELSGMHEPASVDAMKLLFEL